MSDGDDELKAESSDDSPPVSGQRGLTAGEPQLADDIWRQLMSEAPLSLVVRSGYVEALVAQGRLTEADDEARQMAKHFELFAAASVWRSRIAQQQERTLDARRHLEDAVRHVPDDLPALIALCEHCYDQQRWPDAEVALRELIRRVPQDVGALGNLANVNLCLGREIEARQLYRRLLQLDPDNAVARHNLDYLEQQRHTTNTLEA